MRRAGAVTRPLACLLVGLSLVAGACSVQGGGARADVTAPSTTRPGTTPTTTGDGSTTTTDDPSATPQIRWKDCDGGVDCGTLRVPVDHDRPMGQTLELGLVRKPAREPDRRIGALFVNPGGPGAAATDFVEQLPLPRAVTERFDIIGVDPRGTGRSTPLDCHSHLQQIYDDDPTPDDATERQDLLDDSKAFVDECEQRHADLLPFLGTTDVVRDMDLVRAALGDDQLSYLGYSYGTSIGQEYAHLFPTRVRAMALDGVVDLSVDGLTGADAQAGGFEAAFGSFSRHCDDDGCDLDGTAPAVTDRVMAAAERSAIPAPDADRPATPGVVALGITAAMYTEFYWVDLERALRAADDGDGSGLVDLADLYLRRGDDGDYPTGFELYFAVNCLDQVFPRDPDAVLAAAAQAEERHPRFGAAVVSDYVRCALWPTPAKPLAPVPATTRGLPPVVVISTTGDPATPYESGVRVADQIPGAVLVTNDGDGHTVYAQGKACVDDAVNAYLLTVDAPQDGLRCR